MRGCEGVEGVGLLHSLLAMLSLNTNAPINAIL